MEKTLGAHASDELLEQYSMGTLPEAQAGPLEEHLLVCTTCQDRLEQTDQFLAAARAAARKLREEPPSNRISGQMWALGMAAIVVVLILAVRPWQFLNSSTGPPVTVVLQTVRGQEGLASSIAPPGKPLILMVDLNDLPNLASFRLEIVDAQGSQVWGAPVTPKDRKIAVPVSKKFSRGTYWVRLYSQPGELMREFALKIG